MQELGRCFHLDALIEKSQISVTEEDEVVRL
jgi:hypothetical protein